MHEINAQRVPSRAAGYYLCVTHMLRVYYHHAIPPHLPAGGQDRHWLGSVGFGWDRLALVGIGWHWLGAAGIGWHRLASVGSGWHRLGAAGIGWERLGTNGYHGYNGDP